MELAKSAFAKLLGNAQRKLGQRSGTWNVSEEVLSGLVERPEPESCRGTVRDSLSMLQP